MVGPLDGHKPIAVHTGQKLTLVACESFGLPQTTHEGGHVVPIMLELLCEVVKPGTLMLLDEGSIQLQVPQQDSLPCVGLLMRCCTPSIAPVGGLLMRCCTPCIVSVGNAQVKEQQQMKC